MKAASDACGSGPDPCRHRDDGRRIEAFLGERCDVLCPRCGKNGVVRYERSGAWQVAAGFTCAGCALSVRAAPGNVFSTECLPDAPWYGRGLHVGSRACGHCGARWLCCRREFDPSDRPPARSEIDVRCRQCGQLSPVATIPHRLRDWSVGCEPVFGMRLSLSEAVLPGKIVWAFNPPHLEELKRFVSAKLRGHGAVSNASMCSRLPEWMKSSRNRRKVLRAISRIEQRIRA